MRGEKERRERDEIHEQKESGKREGVCVKDANRKITREKLTKHSHRENRVREGNEVEWQRKEKLKRSSG